MSVSDRGASPEREGQAVNVPPLKGARRVFGKVPGLIRKRKQQEDSSGDDQGETTDEGSEDENGYGPDEALKPQSESGRAGDSYKTSGPQVESDLESETDGNQKPKAGESPGHGADE
jgi:hypothetical protein